MWPIDVADQRRFWAKVDKTGACWLWTASCTKSGGYGQIMIAGQPLRAHRVSFALAHGRDPEGNVLHRCDNPRCVRPEHLFEGTDLDNVLDMEKKGRARHPRGTAHGQARLTPPRVRQLRRRVQGGESLRSVARSLGIHHRTAGKVMAGETWSHVI